MYSVVITGALVLQVLSLVSSANILGIFLAPSFSHQRSFQPIYRELALRGHNVTVVTPHPLKDKTIPNLIEIDIQNVSYTALMKHNVTKSSIYEDSSDITPFVYLLIDLMNAQLPSPQFQELLRQDLTKYDLLIGEVMSPAVFPIMDLCNCPMIGMTSMPLMTIMHTLIGNPAHPIVTPDFNLPFSTNLNFWERLWSVWYYVKLRFTFEKCQQLMKTEIYKHFGADTRDLTELMMDMDLVLANVNPVLTPPRANIPGVIEFSGIHITPPAPLPKDIKDFLDNSSRGVIYMSFGSSIKSTGLPKNVIDVFFKVISNMPYDFIWKFESDNLPSKPTNLFTAKWLPQQDILRHPNIKLFVTQGGLQSWEESLYAKVPVVVIPMLRDQHGNARNIEEIGMGVIVKYAELTYEALEAAIQEVIQNDSYKTTTKRLYDIATDQPMTGVDKAVWWVEYMLRHKDGKHLRSTEFGMPTYQYYMLDVAGFIIGVLVLILVIVNLLYSRGRKLLSKIKKD